MWHTITYTAYEFPHVTTNAYDALSPTHEWSAESQTGERDFCLWTFPHFCYSCFPDGYRHNAFLNL